MGILVIACYRPHTGKEDALAEEVRAHVPTLRSWGLATEREPVLMRSADGTVVEVFEWVSQHAIDQAHEDPKVQDMWARFATVCDYVAVSDLPEAGEAFAGFTPLDP